MLYKIRKKVKKIIKEKIAEEELATTPTSCIGCVADGQPRHPASVAWPTTSVGRSITFLKKKRAKRVKKGSPFFKEGGQSLSVFICGLKGKVPKKGAFPLSLDFPAPSFPSRFWP